MLLYVFINSGLVSPLTFKFSEGLSVLYSGIFIGVGFFSFDFVFVTEFSDLFGLFSFVLVLIFVFLASLGIRFVVSFSFPGILLGSFGDICFEFGNCLVVNFFDSLVLDNSPIFLFVYNRDLNYNYQFLLIIYNYIIYN